MCKFCNDTNEQYTEEVYEPSTSKLIITVDGGCVTDVEGGPESLTVEVWDFDVVVDGDSINVDGDRFERKILRV